MAGAQRFKRGFTLVEVLVALFVMALMAALAWRGVDGVLRARDAGRDSIDRTMLLTTLMSQWETDLQSLHQNTVVPSSLAFDGRTLRLVRRAGDAVQLVAWWLDGGTWRRWSAEPTTRGDELQQAWLRSQQLQGTEPGSVRLLEGVSEWQVYFYRGNGWSNAQSTGDVDDAPSASAAPQSVAPEAVAPQAAGPQTPATAPPVERLPSAVRLVLTVDGKTLTRDIAIVPVS